MAAVSCRADVEGVVFAAHDVDTCDVLFDGRRVLSVAPREGVANGQGVRCPWPPALTEFLVGHCTVTVRGHVSGEVYFEDDVRFDDKDTHVAVVDADGEPLAVQKWGTLGRALSDSDDKRELIELTARLLADLNDKVGIPAYIAYGTLLGAVREGKVIGHDFDADIAYLVEPGDPASIALESFRVQRELKALGWRVDRSRNSRLVVWSNDRNIDIFVSYFVGETYYLDQWVEGPLRREQILPLRTATIEGIDVPAPADPEGLLALNFGPTWRIPDPAFKYSMTKAQSARINGWFGAHEFGRARWLDYWATTPDPTAKNASPFAQWVADRAERDRPIHDVACGTGSDCLSFAERGFRATGYDLIGPALARGRAAAAQLPRDRRPAFVRMSLVDGRDTLATGVGIALGHRPCTLYARFALDTLPDAAYQNFWLLLRLTMAAGGDVFVEHRADPRPAFAMPAWLWYRQLDPEQVQQRLREAGGIVVEHEEIPAKAAGVRTPVHRVWARFERRHDPR